MIIVKPPGCPFRHWPSDLRGGRVGGSDGRRGPHDSWAQATSDRPYRPNPSDQARPAARQEVV